MSHPGYLPDCDVSIHAVFYLKVTFFQMSSERGGRDKPTKWLHT